MVWDVLQQLKRANSIRAMQSLESNTFEEKTLRERLAKLTGGVAIIRVGGASEAEMKERKDRADDAVNALGAANEGFSRVGDKHIHALRFLVMAERKSAVSRHEFYDVP